MTTTRAPLSVGDSEASDAPFPPAPVEELIRLVLKAARAHQLYLPNNPIYKGALDTVRAAFAPIWKHVDELNFEFTETEIRWFGHPVLTEHGKSADSLAWICYKDGVRELKILKGFEDEELVVLLNILQRARKASPEEDDLLTMLWESDFGFLRYRYLDMGTEPASPLADGSEMRTVDSGGSRTSTAVTAGEVSAATRGAVEETKEAGIVNLADFDSTLYFLDEKEVDYIQSEIRREYQDDLRSKVTATLLDIFEQQQSEVRTEVLEILDGMLVHLLASGHFRGVAYLLREANGTAQRASGLTSEQKQLLLDLPARISTPEALSQLLQSLDDATDLPPHAELMELFDQLRPTALATVFSWLNRSQNVRLRPLLEAAAERLASANTSELVRLILAPEREVAVEAIRRAGALKTPIAVQSLSTILSGADAELRQLAVQALTEIGSPTAWQAMERAVEDADRDVRINTVRAFAARNYRPVLGRIEAAVKGRGIREADLTEKMAFFEAFGTLCAEDGLDFLDEVLNGKGFLGRREDTELRACAAIALGRAGSQKASDLLRKASSDKDVVVRNAVNRALRGASA